MGDILFGSTTQGKNVELLSPEQQSMLSQSITQLGPQFQQSLGQFLQPKGYEDYKGMFNEQYVKPAQQAYERFTLPSIQQRFVDADAGSSSALNQALAQSAGDLSTALGTQFGQFMQGQQQNQLGALGLYSPFLTAQTFSPLLNQQQGIAGDLIKALGQAGAAYLAANAPIAAAASSHEYKENIQESSMGLEDIRKMNVKHYDYKEDFGGRKDNIGLIAEELPEELVKDIHGLKCVDIYGLCSVLVNAVKELSQEIDTLKGKPCHNQ